ncbi:MAG: dihydrofolate reductase [Oscillatoriophycideae cyanobacterium NC_groundwater_1537_Pr4_S-0.65um_50_18]|nr:dihydrofolate reductase [Oscillatoriophycideae cyanobacterium NC_groundwater_1537_Pr4_S-0.65um_50_18]
MRKVVLFIASSLDGYIARPSGEIDWLFTDQDYGYTPFLESIDTVLVGRTTYEQILTFGEYPYAGKKSYVFTKNPDRTSDQNIEFVSGDVTSLVKALQSSEGKDIWLAGGSALIRDFMHHQLVDQIILSIHPIILGEGIPLFVNAIAPSSLKLTQCQRYDSDLVQLSYDVKDRTQNKTIPD